MNHLQQKYYPTILQAIHLVILYIFIQTIVDFPLALIDYFKDTEYLYHPIKKIVLGIGSVVFILIYGFRKSKAPFFMVFPMKFFNPLIVLPVIAFFAGAHVLLDEVNILVEKVIPAPVWFWELFNQIFDSDYGWLGAFIKVAVIAPIVEELIFRGLILQGFRKNYNNLVSVIMSALLFALFHLNPWQFPATFVLGLLLGFIMIRTNNILLSILIHAINNFMVLITITYWQEIHSHAIFLMEKENLLYTSGLIVLLSICLIYLFSFNWFRKKRK